MTNHMLTPEPGLDERPALRRALEAFERFQAQLMSSHAPEFTSLDITMAQAKLLYVVTVAGALTMSETAQRVGVSVSTASGAVDHLVGLGMLARSDDPSNRRQVRVSVTEHGTRTLEQMRELSTRQIRRLFALIDDAGLAVIEQATTILADAAREADASTLPPPAVSIPRPPGAGEGPAA